MRTIELLSPAKTADIGIEAIRHGADAVYIGATAYGARAAAGNPIEDIARLFDFAHQFKARVYVTVNTIIFDNELQDVERLLWKLWEIHVDALIIQDLRLLSLHLPPIPLHASTQMDNRTVNKVKSLASLGFSQIVLARELTINQIEDIHKACPDTDLEVFVHGALCVSLSGRCNASEAIFGRSANRGECAQICRMKFDLLDDDKILMKGKHLLSLKDNCQIKNIESLLLAGASSLKIEGRLKDAGYVKNITAAYDKALNEVIAKYPGKFCRRASGHINLKFVPNVLKSFNRGFVTNTNKPEANFDTPKSMGELVGKVNELYTTFFTLETNGAKINNGDGLCYINRKGELVGFRLNKVEDGKYYPLEMQRGLRRGVSLYRNQDQAFDKLLSKPSGDRKVLVDIDMAYDESRHILTISMTDEDAFTVSKDIEQEFEFAHTHQTANIQNQLSKLGDTIFEARQINIHYKKNYFIPLSLLSKARRELCDSLIEERKKYYPQVIQPHNQVVIETEKPFEVTHDNNTPVMICHHCIRRQMGTCIKEGGRKQKLSLRMENGTIFQLQFDCNKCLMKLYLM